MVISFSRKELLRSQLDPEMHELQMILTELDAKGNDGEYRRRLYLRPLVLSRIGELEAEYLKLDIQPDVAAYADALAFLATEEENRQ